MSAIAELDFDVFNNEQRQDCDTYFWHNCIFSHAWIAFILFDILKIQGGRPLPPHNSFFHSPFHANSYDDPRYGHLAYKSIVF